MRLTEKKENGFYELKNGQEIYGEENGIRLVQIVGKYEDIEEELGIDLITLFKALKNGIYYRNLIGGICRVPKIDLSYYSKYSNKPKVLCLVEREDDYDEQIIAHYLFKDYGKTWALTQSELTKE